MKKLAELYLLLRTPTISKIKMNILVVMCMLVVLAVNAQSGEEMETEMETETEMEPTVESFQAFLEVSIPCSLLYLVVIHSLYGDERWIYYFLVL